MKNILFVFFVAVFGKTYACDCIMHPIQNYIDTSQFILIAKVDKVFPDTTREHGPWDPARGYSGVLTTTLVLKGGLQYHEKITFSDRLSGCDYRFELGKEYLLFAFVSNGKFYVSPCSYSEEVKKSKKNIRKVKRYIRKRWKIQRP